MKHTVILRPPASPGPSDVYIVTAWQRQIGEMTAAGDILVLLRSQADGPDIPIPSPVFGILSKKIVLPGEAVEVGEPLALLSGVSDTLLTETTKGSFSAVPPYVPTGPEDIVTLSPSEQAVARHMARSLREAPHVYSVVVIDATEALRMAARLESDLLPFLVSAAATALTRFPELNAERADGDEGLRRKRYVNIGLVRHDAAGGLAVPVICDADRKSIRALSEECRRLCGLATEGSLPSDAMRGATFTISQSATARYSTPILHQPQAGHLCVGAVERIPLALDGERIAVRSVIHLCLAHDARIVHVETAEAFLTDIKQNLEEARFLFSA